MEECRSEEVSVPKTSSIRPAVWPVSIQYQLVTDTDTDGQIQTPIYG